MWIYEGLCGPVTHMPFQTLYEAVHTLTYVCTVQLISLCDTERPVFSLTYTDLLYLNLSVRTGASTSDSSYDLLSRNVMNYYEFTFA